MSKIRIVADITVDEEETDYKGEALLKMIKESVEEAFNEEPGLWELKSVKFVSEMVQCPKCLGRGEEVRSGEQFREVPCEMCRGTGVIKT